MTATLEPSAVPAPANSCVPTCSDPARTGAQHRSVGTQLRKPSGHIQELFSAFIAVLIASLVAASTLTATAAGATEAEDEATFVALINELRTGLGLGQLAIDTELVAASRDWAIQLRADGVLSHANDLSVGVTSGWAKLGENVGVANNDQVRELFDAFVQSPGHYANLIDPSFTHIGTAVVYDTNGRMWTTHRFMAKVGPATSTSTTLPTTTDTTLPEPTTTLTAQGQQPTTSPSTTTTTNTTTSSSAAEATTTLPVSQSTTSDPDLTSETASSSTTLPELTSPAAHVPLTAIPTAPLDQDLLTELFALLDS